jgi:predicted MPP superfamily phosphohydrolase
VSAETASKVVGALALAAVGVAAWGVLVERNRFTLREVTVEALPAGSQPLRVLHLSDIHLAPWQRAKQRWVRALAQLKPDLIVNTGDNWGTKDALDAVRHMFEPFAGTPGVFVFGSNDHHGPRLKNPLSYFAGPSKAHEEPVALDVAGLTDLFETELGWTNLNNTAASLTVAGRTVEFFGVDDPHHRLDDPDAMLDALDGVRSVAPKSAARFGVAHAPYARTLKLLAEAGADVMFAGHTHGGQVCLPGYGALVTNCDLPRESAKGFSIWEGPNGEVPLHVSAGLGTSIFAPVRFACPPEATLITLVARKG